MHEMHSAFCRLQWQIDNPGCKAEEYEFQILNLVSRLDDIAPIHVSWRNHRWLWNIKSRIAGNADSSPCLRIEISAL